MSHFWLSLVIVTSFIVKCMFGVVTVVQGAGIASRLRTASSSAAIFNCALKLSSLAFLSYLDDFWCVSNSLVCPEVWCVRVSECPRLEWGSILVFDPQSEVVPFAWWRKYYRCSSARYVLQIVLKSVEPSFPRMLLPLLKRKSLPGKAPPSLDAPLSVHFRWRWSYEL